MRCMEPIDSPNEDTVQAQASVPSTSMDEPIESSIPAKPKRRKFVLCVLLLFLATLILATSGGYLVGTQQGKEKHDQAIRQVTDEQYQLALEDLEAGRYEIARQRLEYISRLDPTYPGIAENLAEALLVLNAPTSTPIVIITPTPNLSPVTDLFQQAQDAFSEEDWTLTIETLLALRVKDPSYQPIDVDRLMFAALRNRGIQRISQEGLLEEGIYDLNRAELFGPLDRDADNWRSWADLYLLANSYIGLDWAKATYYFSQLYLIAPYLKTDTYLKYATSAHAYGDQLILENDPCGAVEQYEQSLLAWENPELFPTATKAAKACLTATAPAPKPPPPSEEPTAAEETPQNGDPTATPTATSMPTSTPSS
jgi:tetratricopeptide (TPR) repeat protein